VSQQGNTGGPGTSAGGSADHDSRRSLLVGGQARGVEGVRAAVRGHAARGVDVIKVIVTGGGLTEGPGRWRKRTGRTPGQFIGASPTRTPGLSSIWRKGDGSDPLA